jgi:hypothetical protein
LRKVREAVKRRMVEENDDKIVFGDEEEGHDVAKLRIVPFEFRWDA